MIRGQVMLRPLGIEGIPIFNVENACASAASALHLGWQAVAAGMQPNLTWNPMEPAATITSFIVQVALGDLPHGSIGYQTIFAAGLTLMILTLVFNIVGHFMTRRFRQVY